MRSQHSQNSFFLHHHYVPFLQLLDTEEFNTTGSKNYIVYNNTRINVEPKIQYFYVTLPCVIFSTQIPIKAVDKTNVLISISMVYNKSFREIKNIHVIVRG